MPIGQIRFTKSDSATDCVTLSYSLDRIARGRRLSSRLIKLGLQEMTNNWGPNISVVAQVKINNKSSLSSLSSIGFKESPSTTHGVLNLILNPQTQLSSLD